MQSVYLARTVWAYLLARLDIDPRMSRVPWNFGGGPTCLGGYFPIIALR
jgi:hypothetical protein